MDVLCLLELQLLRIHDQEAQARILAHRIEENQRRRDLWESRRAWDEGGFNHPIVKQGIAKACQCRHGAYQPDCCVRDNYSLTERPVRVHFALGADRNTTLLIYFGTGDEVFSDMYAISADKWDHDSSDESDSSLTLY